MNDVNVQEIARAFRLDEEAREVLGRFWSMFDLHLDRVLDGFYEHFATFPEGARALAGVDVKAIKARQRDHWRKLFAGDLDGVLVSARRVAAAHARVGIGVTLYLASYAYVEGAAIRVVTRAFSGQDREKLLEAIPALFLFDAAASLDAFKPPAVTE